MISTVWSIVVIGFLALWAVVGPWLGHKVGSSGKDKAVDAAKVETESSVRQEVATSTAAAAGQAMKDAAESRTSSARVAHATAAQGDDRLNDALKAQGALRD
jgi:hypothetical protein